MFKPRLWSIQANGCREADEAEESEGSADDSESSTSSSKSSSRSRWFIEGLFGDQSDIQKRCSQNLLQFWLISPCLALDRHTSLSHCILAAFGHWSRALGPNQEMLSWWRCQKIWTLGPWNNHPWFLNVFTNPLYYYDKFQCVSTALDALDQIHQGAGAGSSRAAASVLEFLQHTYWSIAETLPHECLRWFNFSTRGVHSTLVII